MSDDRRLVRKVYEGDVLSPAGDMLVSFQVDAGSFDAAIARLRESIAQMKAATWQIFYPDEKNIIDQD